MQNLFRFLFRNHNLQFKTSFIVPFQHKSMLNSKNKGKNKTNFGNYINFDTISLSYYIFIMNVIQQVGGSKREIHIQSEIKT